MLKSQDDVDESSLIPSFLNYVTPWERELVLLGLDGAPTTSDQDSDMIDFFSRMGMRCIPSKVKNEYRDQVIQMAKSEFLYKPSMLLMWMRQGIPAKHYQKVWARLSPNDLSSLYASLTPTAVKVAQMIVPEKDTELSPKEDRMMYFVKSFVRGP